MGLVIKILIVSAYHAASHDYWLTRLKEIYVDHNLTAVTLPARYFSWRVRGNPISLAGEQKDWHLEAFDLVIATSMVDVATLKGLLPQFCNIPWMVYFHENQFAYPTNSKQQLLEAQITSIYSAMAGTKLLFNSNFNRDSFVEGASKLLKKLPDLVPKSIIPTILDKTEILPVPIAGDFLKKEVNISKTPIVVWNHRWEYDKGPEGLLELAKFAKSNRFHLKVLGQKFRNSPKEFDRLEQFENVEVCGYLAEAQYHQMLFSAEVVISTSLHDFQGLSILEAVEKGCYPIVPNRLAYPQWFGKEYQFESQSNKPKDEAKQIANKIDALRNKAVKLPELDSLTVGSLRTRYLGLLDNA